MLAFHDRKSFNRPFAHAMFAAIASLAVSAAANAQPFPTYGNISPSATQYTGNIGNKSIGWDVPAYPAWTTISSGQYSWNSQSAAYMLYGPYSGLYANYVPGNQFFSESQYSVRCDELQVTPPRDVQEWKGMGAGFVTVHYDATYACRITDAPVVNMDWVRANLDANGYAYKIVYTHENHGNNRALISWIKACWVNIPLSGLPSNTMSLAWCWRGMARLEGAPTWQPWPIGPDTQNWSMGAGGFYGPITPGTDGFSVLTNQPAAWQANAVMLWQWPTSMQNEIAHSPSFWIPRAREFHDDWLVAAPPPPPPPPPPLLCRIFLPTPLVEIQAPSTSGEHPTARGTAAPHQTR